MNEFLENREHFSFVELITRPRSALDLACAFLAMLDAVKNKLIRIKQHKLLAIFSFFAMRQRFLMEKTPDNDASIIGAILFLESEPVGESYLSRISGLSEEEVLNALQRLSAEYESPVHGFAPLRSGGGWIPRAKS